MKVLCATISAILFIGGLKAQTFQTRDKVNLTVDFNLTVVGQAYNYNYSLTNGVGAKESVYVFDLRIPNNIRMFNMNAPTSWKKVFFSDAPEVIRWHAEVDHKTGHFKHPLVPGTTLSGFFFSSSSLPGIVTYYSEGWAPAPVFEEGEATDSIPGYSDLTPYGPGIVGKTVGPVEPPDLSVMTSILDTLISYKHQCLTLGWLKDDKAHKEDCDEMMKERNWYKRGEFEKFRKWEPDESSTWH